MCCVESFCYFKMWHLKTPWYLEGPIFSWKTMVIFFMEQHDIIAGTSVNFKKKRLQSYGTSRAFVVLL